jgi:hypothetical protein
VLQAFPPVGREDAPPSCLFLSASALHTRAVCDREVQSEPRVKPCIQLSGSSLDKEGSSSFLKKRTKKLLSIAPSTGATRLARRRRVTSKSFLVLFFKKELLPSCLAFVP